MLSELCGCNIRPVMEGFLWAASSIKRLLVWLHFSFYCCGFNPETFDWWMPIFCAMPYPVCLSLYRCLVDCNLTPELRGVGFKLFMLGVLLELELNFGHRRTKKKCVVTWFLCSLFSSVSDALKYILKDILSEVVSLDSVTVVRFSVMERN